MWVDSAGLVIKPCPCTDRLADRPQLPRLRLRPCDAPSDVLALRREEMRSVLRAFVCPINLQHAHYAAPTAAVRGANFSLHGF